MAINERKRQQKLARKNAKRRKTLLAQKKAMAELPIILEDYPEDYPEKMSEVILDFAEPLLDEADSPEQMRRAISIAIMAWNSALLPTNQQQELFEKVFEEEAIRDDRAREALLAGIEIMVERKRQYFADIDRMVISYQIDDTDDGIHLSVVSTYLTNF